MSDDRFELNPEDIVWLPDEEEAKKISKLELGHGDETYGTVEATRNGLKYSGNNVQAMRNLLASIPREAGQDDAAFLASLPKRLSGRTWAREAGKLPHQQQPAEPPGPPDWQEGPGLPPEVQAWLKKKLEGK